MFAQRPQERHPRPDGTSATHAPLRCSFHRAELAMAWGCLPWLCGSLRDAEHRHEALQAATAGPAAPKAAAQQATVTVETYVDALAEQKERWAKLARRGKRKPMFPIREEQEGAPAIDT